MGPGTNAHQEIDKVELSKQTFVAEQSFGFLHDVVDEVDIDE